ncbi:Transposase family Tnp2 protein [Ceratobasidium sp. AG-Ba]|nr:Transposase family Tnp2 protein [Ceratobasidium sp. AG-Ba]QRW02594.1 Transposase family Tnp2 protein [Ceratobasidium sp. AG-Ba]
MDSDSSGSESDYSDEEYGYGNLDSDTYDKPAADGKVNCTCGCGDQRNCQTKRRYLKEICERLRLNQDIHGQEFQDEVPMGVGQGLDREDADQEDLPMLYQDEEEWEQPSSPTDNWHNIATPPPSPPPFDPDPPSKDEHGYVNVNAEGYREYDRWFAEDLEPELDEFVRETITEQELDSIKTAAIRQFGHISQGNYKLVSIVKCLIRVENLTERIEQLREEMAGYVERYEE